MRSFFPRGVLDEILNLIESVSKGFPSYSFTGEQSRCHELGRTQCTKCTVLADTHISETRTILIGVVSIAQLVKVTDSAVLAAVLEIVSSNPARIINLFSVFIGIAGLFKYIYI